MTSFNELILKNISEFDIFLSNTETLIIIHLDKDLNISSHNECFKNLIQTEKDCSGQNIYPFLLPESQGVLPLSDSKKHLSVMLNFKSADSSPAPLCCHIFKSLERHLIMGGNLLLTNEKILQKMTVLTNEMANMTRDLSRKNRELEQAHSKVKILSGIVPICMHCKEIRDDKGYWSQLEKFITEHSEAQFSHSICDKCQKKHYSDL